MAYKIMTGNERGIPDLLCCINGKFVGIEVKGHGDSLTEIQKAQMQRIDNAGGCSYAVHSLDEFKQILKEAK